MTDFLTDRQYCNWIRDQPTALEMLRERNIIRQDPPTCRICNQDMTEVSRGINRSSIWRCTVHKSVKKGIMAGSMFEGSHMSFTQIVGILHHFCYETSIKKAAKSLELQTNTVCYWYKRLREEICAWWLRQPGHRRRIGGMDQGRRIIVEIDESAINKRKPGPMIGRYRATRWVFGGCCPEQGIGFVVPVPNRQAITLEPQMIRHIAPGSMIHHDDWGAYRRPRIPNIPVNPRYDDDVINHRVEFVNVRGATTNHAERYWKEIKQRFKMMNGVAGSTLEGHLKEFQWRQRVRGTIFTSLLEQIADRFPVN